MLTWSTTIGAWLRNSLRGTSPTTSLSVQSRQLLLHLQLVSRKTAERLSCEGGHQDGGWSWRPEPAGVSHDSPTHWKAPALQTPPKFHEKTPRETQKERHGSGRGQKKRGILGGPGEGVRCRVVWHRSGESKPNLANPTLAEMEGGGQTRIIRSPRSFINHN